MVGAGIAICLLVTHALSAQGVIQTIAGTDWLFPSDGQSAVNAALGRPALDPFAATQGVAFDSLGNLYAVKADGSATLAGSATPAKAGHDVVIYGWGMGPVNVPVVEGAPAPLSLAASTVNPVTVSIGGVNARVDFAGLTPLFAGHIRSMPRSLKA